MTPSEMIEEARARSRKQHSDWEFEQRRLMAESERTRGLFARDVLPHLRQARAQDYSLWIAGYLAGGGKITHAYDRPFSRADDWFVAFRDFTLMPLYGALSVNIIVPEGITVVCPDPGHSKLYFLDGFTVGIPGQHFSVSVPVFSDTSV